MFFFGNCDCRCGLLSSCWNCGGLVPCSPHWDTWDLHPTVISTTHHTLSKVNGIDTLEAVGSSCLWRSLYWVYVWCWWLWDGCWGVVSEQPTIQHLLIWSPSDVSQINFSSSGRSMLRILSCRLAWTGFCTSTLVLTLFLPLYSLPSGLSVETSLTLPPRHDGSGNVCVPLSLSPISSPVSAPPCVKCVLLVIAYSDRESSAPGQTSSM